MRYINTGAFIDGERAYTKKALKYAMANHPHLVSFDSTSVFDAENSFAGDALPKDAKLSVVGPDPETSRKWYATVTPDGKVT